MSDDDNKNNIKLPGSKKVDVIFLCYVGLGNQEEIGS